MAPPRTGRLPSAVFHQNLNTPAERNSDDRVLKRLRQRFQNLLRREFFATHLGKFGVSAVAAAGKQLENLRAFSVDGGPAAEQAEIRYRAVAQPLGQPEMQTVCFGASCRPSAARTESARALVSASPREHHRAPGQATTVG